MHSADSVHTADTVHKPDTTRFPGKPPGMTLTSASTDAEVEAAYDDNADYRDTASITKARLFAQACRLLVRRYTSGVSSDGTSINRNVELIRDELRDVDTWLDGNDPARSQSSTVVYDFRESRS